jgi:tRNA pseudouridine55 synthase
MRNFANKLFILNKNRGPTSFEVVKALREAAGTKKAGHAGTLDPLAEGVLLICTGTATRATSYFMDLPKTYEFEMLLGVGTTTLDCEGEIVSEVEVPEMGREDIESVVKSFLGEQEQKPPMYSAVKLNGKRLYELARSGEEAEAAKRTIRIHEIEVLDCELPSLAVRVVCSRGTYVRALAADIGAKLGLPSHVTKLVRTSVGKFDLDAAYPAEKIFAGEIEDLEGMELAEALDFLPAVIVTDEAAEALRHGIRPGRADVVEEIGELGENKTARILDGRGNLIAVGDTDEGEALFRGYRLFALDGAA